MPRLDVMNASSSVRELWPCLTKLVKPVGCSEAVGRLYLAPGATTAAAEVGFVAHRLGGLLVVCGVLLTIQRPATELI